MAAADTDCVVCVCDVATCCGDDDVDGDVDDEVGESVLVAVRANDSRAAAAADSC